MPGLRLPSVAQWNGSVEHSFGSRQLLSLAYAGAAGRQLLRRELGGFQDTKTLRVAVATQPISIDISGTSGGTNVLGTLLCTILDTVNNVIGLVNLLNQLLGILGGLTG